MASGLDEEYERELEKQVEQEEERELPAARESRKEADWRWLDVLRGDFLQRCKSSNRPTELVRLETVLGRTHQLSDIQVRFPAALWASRNFVEVLESPSQHLDSRVLEPPSQHLDDYLRLVDATLTFHEDGAAELVLISPREADHLLPVLRRARPSTAGPRLQHFAFLKASRPQLALPKLVKPVFTFRFSPPERAPTLDATGMLIAVLQLFMGECTYVRERRQHVSTFLKLVDGTDSQCESVGTSSSSDGRKLAERIVAARGRLNLFVRSDLQKLLIGQVQA